MLLTIAATIVCLGVLIFVHELGHFLAAKSVDIEVSRFSIGFGPKLFGFTRGETEYVISALPLGGYVKMEGMAGEEVTENLEGGAVSSEPREPGPRDFDAKPLWARFYVIIAGVAMNTLFAIVAFAWIAGVNGIHIPQIGEVVPGSPAEQAGILPGDVFVSVDGRPVSGFDDAAQDIQERPGETITIELLRDDEPRTVSVQTESVMIYSELARDSLAVGQIGVVSAPREEALRAIGPIEAIGEGFQQTWRWVDNIGSFLGRIFTGQDSASQLGGPILIGELSGQAARMGFFAFLNFMAIISVNLAVLNLLPIPVLDGGHLLFLTIEAVRGKAMSIEQRIRLTQVGMLFVLGLMVLAIANDLLRVFR